MTKGRKPPQDTVFVTGIFGARTRQALVQMTIPSVKDPQIFDPAEARSVGLSLIEAAEAAATDAFLIRILAGYGLDEPKQAAVLRMFRQYREQERAEHGEPDRRVGLATLMQAERDITDRFLQHFLGDEIGLDDDLVALVINDLHDERDGPPEATAA